MPYLFQRLRPRSLPPREGPTRREVLETSLAAAGLLLASCRSRTRPSDSAPRVVVIGAGLAGLACAHELRARGSDVVVLEARARVGGRVHSLDDVLEGASVEAGGEFIGANHPCWQGYAQRFGLALDPITGEEEDVEVPVVLQGQRIAGRELETLWREIDALQNTLTKLAREVDGDAPWNHPFAGALDMRHMSGWVEEQQVSRLAQHGFRVLLAADAGMPTKRQSLLATLGMIAGGGLEAFWTSSESYRCSGGNARLARALAEAVGNERVITGSPVTKVRWNAGSPVEVTSERATIQADRVVLATPPTTWPRIAFDPPLPTGIAPQLGRTVKYIATVSRRVWHDSRQAPEAITDGPISLTWEPARGRTTDRAVISAFSSGEAADHVRSQRGAALKELMLAEFEGLYPGFQDAFVAGRFLDWPGDEWTRAGYSFPAPGETTSRVKRLREPFDALIVAGEHASSRFPGYMEGALESGVRAAELALRSG
ncbi:MAG: FAD-dependent oxidoreductase [Planctomycetota bacterium]|nr:FAD-dependent oxidoreductase [Planctomycetota bacterium]